VSPQISSVISSPFEVTSFYNLWLYFRIHFPPTVLKSMASLFPFQTSFLAVKVPSEVLLSSEATVPLEHNVDLEGFI
jgi:hypothetical protein